MDKNFLPKKKDDDPAFINLTTQHKYTLIQLVCLGILWAVKVTPAGIAFPVVIMLLVPVRRWGLPKVFKTRELSVLDSEDGEE